MRFSGVAIKLFSDVGIAEEFLKRVCARVLDVLPNTSFSSGGLGPGLRVVLFLAPPFFSVMFVVGSFFPTSGPVIWFYRYLGQELSLSFFHN